MYLRRGLITRWPARFPLLCLAHAATLRLHSGRELYREVTRNNADKEFNYRIIGVTANAAAAAASCRLSRFILIIAAALRCFESRSEIKTEIKVPIKRQEFNIPSDGVTSDSQEGKGRVADIESHSLISDSFGNALFIIRMSSSRRSRQKTAKTPNRCSACEGEPFRKVAKLNPVYRRATFVIPAERDVDKLSLPCFFLGDHRALWRR